MFNNYVEMLKKATEAMTSLHHTEQALRSTSAQ